MTVDCLMRSIQRRVLSICQLINSYVYRIRAVTRSIFKVRFAGMQLVVPFPYTPLRAENGRSENATLFLSPIQFE